MVADVAVMDGSAADIGERNVDAHRLADRNVDGVLPSGARGSVRDEKGPNVEVEGVVHDRRVADLAGSEEPPALDHARFGSHVGAFDAVDKDRFALSARIQSIGLESNASGPSAIGGSGRTQIRSVEPAISSMSSTMAIAPARPAATCSATVPWAWGGTRTARCDGRTGCRRCRSVSRRA